MAMQLYNYFRSSASFRVRIALNLKGLAYDYVPVHLAKGEHKLDAYAAVSADRLVPMLELDDGTCISETVAICRYFEETHPETPMFGRTAVEKAQVDMWIRRIEFTVMMPVGMFWRHAHPFTAALLTQFKDFGESNRETYNGAQKWLNRELEGREFLVGDSLTMADICLLSTVDFADWIGLPVLEEYEHLAAWRARMKARPSADA